MDRSVSRVTSINTDVQLCLFSVLLSSCSEMSITSGAKPRPDLRLKKNSFWKLFVRSLRYCLMLVLNRTVVIYAEHCRSLESGHELQTVATLRRTYKNKPKTPHWAGLYQAQKDY